jgi:HlyD family secretion protein
VQVPTRAGLGKHLTRGPNPPPCLTCDLQIQLSLCHHLKIYHNYLQDRNQGRAPCLSNYLLTYLHLPTQSKQSFLGPGPRSWLENSTNQGKIRKAVSILKFFRTSRKRILALISAVVIPGSVYAASQTQIGPFKKTIKVETAKVKQGDISQTISASGEIIADTQVELKFQTSGQLAWVGVKEGDQVKKWQAIASLDKRELEKRFKKELNLYLRERTEFDDTQDTYKDTPLSDAIKRLKERAQIDLDQTVLDVEIRDITLKFATLFSPIDGIVISIDTPMAGVNITPATAVFTVADPNSLIFEAEVDETDIRFIKEGQKVQLMLDAFPDKELTGQVTQISFTSRTSRGGGTVFPIKISLPKKDSLTYRLGMNGDADFVVQTSKNALVVPVEALLPDNQVWVKRGEAFEKINVETKIESDAEVEVVNNLSEEDEVVISGFDYLENK